MLTATHKWLLTSYWRTWLFHGVIAIPIAYATSPLLLLGGAPWAIAFRLASIATVALFIVRELEHLLDSVRNGWVIQWGDHLGDVMGPIITLAVWQWLVL